MADLTEDLNQTITAAVNARVEASILEAMSGDETIGRYVLAALQQPVPQRDRYGNTSRETQPYITTVLKAAIQKAAKEACERFVAEELGLIEDEVRKALRRDVKRIASSLTESLTKAAGKPYGFDVKLDLKMPSGG